MYYRRFWGPVNLYLDQSFDKELSIAKVSNMVGGCGADTSSEGAIISKTACVEGHGSNKGPLTFNHATLVGLNAAAKLLAMHWVPCIRNTDDPGT